jgi:hypothetical protein
MDYAHWHHDVSLALERSHKLKEEKAYEVVGRYPSYLQCLYTQGRSASYAAALVFEHWVERTKRK